MKKVACISVLAIGLMSPFFAHAADISPAANDPTALAGPSQNPVLADNSALPDVGGTDIAANSMDDKLAPSDSDMD